MVSRYTEIENLFLPEFLPNDNYAADNLIDEFFIREPTVDAGSFQWIPYPGNSATLTGSATAYDGKTITSYLWELVSGTGTITSNTSASTGVTALGNGFNAFKLTATDSDGVTSSGYVQVFVASVNSARWNFTKTAFAVAGNNNMIAGASVIGSLSQRDSSTDWKLLTNGGEWEPYLGSFQALNNGEGGSSAGSPTYTTFSANELQGAFLQAGHSTAIGGKYPLELHGLPAGDYKLYLIGSIKSSINSNVPNGQFKVKFGSASETTQSIAQQSNYTTPALVFDGSLTEGEIIQFGPYTLTEGNGDATVFNCLFIEKIESGLSLVLPLIASTTTLYSPTLVPGSVNVTLPAIAATTTLYAPAVVPVQTLTLPDIAATTNLFSPTIVPGSVNVTLPQISSTAIYSPVIVPGSVSVTMPSISSTAALYAPVIVPGSVSIQLPFISSGAQLFAPSVVASGGLGLPVISSTTVLYEPTLIPGSISVLLPVISSTQLFAPTVQPGSVSVQLPAIASGSQLYTPAFGTTISLPFISGGAVFAPVIIPGQVTISLPILESLSELFVPEVIAGSVDLILPHISSTVMYPPLIIEGGTLRIWDGAQWVPGNMFIWDGTQWVGDPKLFYGGNWVTL